jgi:peptidoglycan lytic transglycosylase D
VRQTRLLVGLALIGACSRSGAAPRVHPTPERATVTQSSTSDTTPGHASRRPQETVRAVSVDTLAERLNDSTRVSPSDITRGAAAVFGDSAAKEAFAVHDSVAPVAGPTWDIDVRPYESTDRVEHYVRMFTGSSKEHIQARLSRGTRYEPMIRAKMREGGLPEDMYYLALVESGFDPNAYSRAAAVGMWQFMTSTARDIGMRVDWWVDERRDPVRSTIAAVRFLRDLKEQFGGSLYLAAAAYNGGPGRVSRGLSRYANDLEGTAGEDLFFALAEKDYLRNETREYVPQLIAAALIAKDPQRYGLEIKSEAPFEYDSVKVGPATPLAAIARASSSTVEEIKELNPHVLRGMTPPRDSMKIRIPVGGAAQFDSALAALAPEERKAISTSETKKGERIEDLAYRLKTSARTLNTFNPTLKKSKKTGKLIPGQTVIVPTRAVALAAVSVPDPSIERYPSSSRMVRIHVVKRGENLSLIAKKYHTTTKTLMQLNGLRRPLIVPGQELVVARGGKAKRSGRAVSAASSKARRSAAKGGAH